MLSSNRFRELIEAALKLAAKFTNLGRAGLGLGLGLGLDYNTAIYTQFIES